MSSASLQRVDRLFGALADADGYVSIEGLARFMTFCGDSAESAESEAMDLLYPDGKMMPSEIVEGDDGQRMAREFDDNPNSCKLLTYEQALPGYREAFPCDATDGEEGSDGEENSEKGHLTSQQRVERLFSALADDDGYVSSEGLVHFFMKCGNTRQAAQDGAREILGSIDKMKANEIAVGQVGQSLATGCDKNAMESDLSALEQVLCRKGA